MGIIELLTAVVGPAILPVVADGLRAGLNRLFGGAGVAPANSKEYIDMQNADTERLKALGALEGSIGNTSQWVNNVRALQRPFVGAVVLFGWIGSWFVAMEPTTAQAVMQLASSVIFYLFGDRTYMYLTQNKGLKK